MIIKQWAVHRGINNPAYGTLCTYGYILMLLRYLQVCDPPMLLSLQVYYNLNFRHYHQIGME